MFCSFTGSLNFLDLAIEVLGCTHNHNPLLALSGALYTRSSSFPMIGDLLVLKFDGKRVTFSRTSLERMWEPPATTTGSKNWIFIVLSFEIEGRPFRVGGGFGGQNKAKIDVRIDAKLT